MLSQRTFQEVREIKDPCAPALTGLSYYHCTSSHPPTQRPTWPPTHTDKYKNSKFEQTLFLTLVTDNQGSPNEFNCNASTASPNKLNIA